MFINIISGAPIIIRHKTFIVHFHFDQHINLSVIFEMKMDIAPKETFVR